MSAHALPEKFVRCELQTWSVSTNAEGTQNRVLVNNATEKKNGDDEDVYALVLERVYDFGSSVPTKSLTVNSPHILRALKATVSLHPSVSGDLTSSTIIRGPFQILVFYWDDILDHVETVEDDDARMHLNLLVDFMNTEIGPDKKAFDYQHSVGTCEFGTLWAIFKPGELVFTRDKDQPLLMKVVKTAYEESSGGKYLEVQCAFTDHNGRAAGEGSRDHSIYRSTHFGQGDPAKIRDLDIYPRSYCTEGKELESDLLERGRRFIALSQGVSVRNYDGVALYLKEPPPTWYSLDQGQDPKSWAAYTETGRVVIDRKGYGEEHVAPKVTQKFDITDEDLILCPAFIYGYSCARKEWCRFLLPLLVDATWKPNPFEQIVLPGKQKSLIKALVSSHTYPEDSRDQTLQKGRGLVVLLHGTPGSGKTLTAECAAEHTQRALLSCTMSELNEYNYPASFERKLSRILRLATSWKAIILLDEADVFLEARQDGNGADRNALVAIFLKHLEYFGGVIFLTTNRIQAFDQAMRSRVHLALAFKPPQREARRQIWAYQLSKLPAGVLHADVEMLLDRVQDEDVNGREIANALLTAATLARYNKEPLDLEHIETVMEVRRDFTNELKKLAHATKDPKAHRAGSFPIRQNSMLDEILTEEPEEV